jgi:DNA-binding phage protein
MNKPKPEYDKEVFEGKMPWSERASKIRQQFPSTVSLDWAEVFKQDPTILGRIVNDILRLDFAEKGRPGKRTAAPYEKTREHLSRYMDEAHTMLPFHEILTILKGDRSVRHMATKCNMHYSRLFTLLKANGDPTVDEMRLVAKAFGKHPSFFVEYRVAYVTGMIAERLTNAPEASVVQYKKIAGWHEGRQ